MAKIDFLELAEIAVKIAEDKKARDAFIFDVRKLTAATNYFVIVTAESAPQINAVAQDIEKVFKERGITILRKEGTSSPSWKVLDYGGMMAHIMSPEMRELYKLENLWEKSKIAAPSEMKAAKSKKSAKSAETKPVKKVKVKVK
jgi:ribosome-associated protein